MKSVSHSILISLYIFGRFYYDKLTKKQYSHNRNKRHKIAYIKGERNGMATIFALLNVQLMYHFHISPYSSCIMTFPSIF